MSTAITADQSLEFSRSTSQSVGMKGSFMDMLHDNAARIVGVMKLAGDIAAGFTGAPLMMASAGFSIVGRLMLIGFGTKENQKKQQEKEKQEHGEDKPANVVSKVLQPHKYPVEASTGLSVVAEGLATAYGISRFMDGKTGYTPLIVGLTSIMSYANILFTKEKKKSKEAQKTAGEKPATSELTFAKSESKSVGLVGTLINKAKGNPVMVSSLYSMGISAFYLIGGIVEKIPALAVAGAIFLAAYSFQAAFVRKSEFNVEGGKDAPATEPPSKHAEKVAQQRRDSAKGGQNGFAPSTP